MKPSMRARSVAAALLALALAGCSKGRGTGAGAGASTSAASSGVVSSSSGTGGAQSGSGGAQAGSGGSVAGSGGSGGASGTGGAGGTTTAPRSDIVGKITVGYQGWFDAAGDGSGITPPWWHWTPDRNTPSPSDIGIKSWPDVSDYGKTYATSLPNLGGGAAA